MIDPTGTVIGLLRDDLAVTAIVGVRVRGGEPAEKDVPPMVIVSRVAASRDPGGGDNRRLGLQEVFLQVKCYGTTRAQAAQLYGACSDVLHLHAPLIDLAGRTLFTIMDDVGSSSGVDPGTWWPWEDTTMRVIAAAEALM